MKDATIVFDLDGTLVDTAPDLISATNHVLQSINILPVDSKIARSWISFGARHMIVEALKPANQKFSDPQIDELLDIFLDHYKANIAVHSRPFPGVEAMLDRLTQSGVRLAVCTNKREVLAKQVLDELQLSSKFHALVGRDTLEVSKPHPGHILGTIAMANGDPARAIMVGDSANDINAANAANIRSIAVSFGYSDVPAHKLGASAVIDSYAQIDPLLETLLA